MIKSDRLAKWEAEKGFEGVELACGLIRRKCSECNQPTIRLAESKCPKHGGKRQERRTVGTARAARAQTPIVKSARLVKWEEERGFEGVERKSGHGPICRKCSECNQPTRSMTESKCAKHGGERQVCKVCTRDGCARVAMKQSLCPACWVDDDPATRGCPQCQTLPRRQTHQDGLCGNCERKNAIEQKRVAGEARLTAFCTERGVERAPADPSDASLGVVYGRVCQPHYEPYLAVVQGVKWEPGCTHGLALYQCTSCCPLERLIGQTGRCNACGKSIAKERYALGLCAECDTDTQHVRKEHYLRALLRLLWPVPADAEDDVRFGYNCAKGPDDRKYVRPDFLYAIRDAEGKLLGSINVECDEHAHLRSDIGKTRKESIQCELSKISHQADSVQAGKQRLETRVVTGTLSKSGANAYDELPNTRRMVAHRVDDVAPHACIKWNPDPHKTDRCRVSYEERVATLLHVMKTLWAMMKEGKFEEGVLHTTFLFYPKRARDAIQAAEESGGMGVTDRFAPLYDAHELEAVREAIAALEKKRKASAAMVEVSRHATEAKRRAREQAEPSTA